ncbi:VCBS domain-containing protein, partial [Aestuariispira insulae]
MVVETPGGSGTGNVSESQSLGSDATRAIDVIEITGPETVTVPHGFLILDAEYSRSGQDMILEGPDGSTVVLQDYYNQDIPPDLITESGAMITATVAQRLAGPLAPGQVAQTGPSEVLGEPIGEVENGVGTITVTRADGTKVQLATGDPVFEGDIIQTGADGSLGIIFVDKSTMSMGEDARLVMDAMVYDPSTNLGTQVFNVVQGAFVFASGVIGKNDPDSVTVTTPVATIGIRGTKYGINVSALDGESTITVFEGAVNVFNDGGQSVLSAFGDSVTISDIGGVHSDVFFMDDGAQKATYGNALSYSPKQPDIDPSEIKDANDSAEVDLDAIADELEGIETAAGPEAQTSGVADIEFLNNLDNDIGGEDVDGPETLGGSGGGGGGGGSGGGSSTQSGQTAQSSETVDEDLTAEPGTVTVNSISAADIEAAAENDETITVSGTAIGGDISEGDEVSFTLDGPDGPITYTTTVDADGNWQADVPGSVLGDDTEFEVTVSSSDAAGNTVTSTGNGIDTNPSDTQPEPGTVTVDAITEDDLVTGVESESDITVSGTATGGDIAEGDTVSFTINGTDYSTTVGADGTWSVDVAGSDLAADQAFTVYVSSTSGGGDAVTSSGVSVHGADTEADAGSVTVDPITSDGILSAQETGGDVTVSGMAAGGDISEGDTVRFTVNGTDYSTTVGADGSWSVDVAGTDLAADTEFEINVVSTDAVGNEVTSSATSTHTVDTQAEAGTVTVDAITSDDVVNAAEAGGDVAVSGTAIGGDISEGDTVSFTVNGTDYSTTVGADGTWSVDVAGSDLAADTELEINVASTDAVGNEVTSSATSTHTVDTEAETGTVTVASITSDDVVNAAEAGGDVAVSGTATGGDISEGDTVSFTVNGTDYSTTVGADGSWSVDVAGADLAADTEFEVSVDSSDTAGNTVTSSATSTHTVDTQAEAGTVTVDAITSDDVVNVAEAGEDVTVSGTAAGGDVSEGDTVSFTVNGKDYSTTVGANGTWSVVVAGADLAADTEFEVSVTSSDAAGNTTTSSTTSTHMVDTQAEAGTVSVDAITSDDVVTATEAGGDITVSGMATGGDISEGDTVSFTVNGTDYTATVGADGSWSADVAGTDLAADTEFEVSVASSDDADNTVTSSTISTHTVDIGADGVTLTAEEEVTATDSDGLGGDDSVDGSASDSDQHLRGGGGDDMIAGGSGSDVLVGDGEPDNLVTAPLGIAAALVDDNEALTVTISGVPEDAVLSAGTQDPDDPTVWTFTSAEELDALGSVTITMPSDAEGFDVTVTATGTETFNGETASESQTISVTVAEFEEGDDVITGGAGDDTLIGGGGDDTLDGGVDVDDVRGGDGSDTGLFTVGEGGEGEIYDGGDGTDSLVVSYSAEDLENPDIVAALHELQDFIGNPDNAGVEQTFDALGLTVKNWESLTLDGPELPSEATVTGDDSVETTEDSVTTATGSLSVTDQNPGEAYFQTQDGTSGTYGSFSIDADGNWSYDLNNDATDVQALGAGDSLTESFTVLTGDGTEETVTITINGTDDAPEISGDDSGAVTEDTTLTASGTLTATDADAGESGFQAQSDTAGSYGSFSIDADGNWSYDLANDATDVQALGAGDSLTESFTVLTGDGTEETVTITINGTDDAPEVSGSFAGAVTEGDEGDVATATGTIAISDIDAGDNPVFEATSESGAYGSLELDGDGNWTYTLDQGSVQDLTAGEVVTDTITLTASDGTTQDITVTITGTDDDAIVSGDFTGSVEEDGSARATGSLSIDDADNANADFVSQNNTEGSYGSFSITPSGNWTFNLDNDNADVQALGDGESLTETFTVVTDEGVESQVTITIDGTDDAPEVSGSFTGAVSEGDAGDVATATGTIAISDIDASDNPVFEATTASGEYGSLELDGDGNWTYTLDQGAVQGLNEGDQVTDTITLTATDGTTQDITVTINGTDDAPEISGDDSGAVTEDTTLTASGSLTATDADAGESGFQAQSDTEGTYGSFSIDADGNWSYDLDNDATDVQALGAGDSLTESFTVLTGDGTEETVTITINGTDDAPEISGDDSGAVTEDTTLTASGTLTATDADAGESGFQAQSDTA